MAKPTLAATPTSAALLEIDDNLLVDFAATAAALVVDVAVGVRAGAAAGAVSVEAVVPPIAGGGGCGGMVDCLRSTMCRTAAPAWEGKCSRKGSVSLPKTTSPAAVNVALSFQNKLRLRAFFHW